ncbi:UNVERIFIED_CONTAM: hypothetical protein K2H54_019993 [Gekko kuhli]
MQKGSSCKELDFGAFADSYRNRQVLHSKVCDQNPNSANGFFAPASSLPPLIGEGKNFFFTHLVWLQIRVVVWFSFSASRIKKYTCYNFPESLDVKPKDSLPLSHPKRKEGNADIQEISISASFGRTLVTLER